MDSVKVEAALNKCLLTDKEMGLGVKLWEAMADPFKERWEGSEEEHGHGHDHRHPHHP